MRKFILPLAPLALALSTGNAFADESSVTLYGVLDAGVANLEHAANFDPNYGAGTVPTNLTKTSPSGGAVSSVTGMFNGGFSASRWGIRGQEDLGDGLKAVFLLESAINVPNGNVSNAALSLATNSPTGPNISNDSSLSGQLFSRGAYAGLSSNELGTLTFGRHQSFFLDNIGIVDPIGAQMFSPISFSGTYGGGGYTDDARADNSVKYRKTIGGLTVGALYKFGGVSGSTSAQGATQFNLAYSAGAWSLVGGVQSFRDAFSLANGYAKYYVGSASGGTATTALPIAGVKATAADTRAYMLAARYTLSKDTSLKAGYERISYSNPSHPAADQAITSLFGQTIVAPASVSAFPNAKIFNVFWIGGSHNVTSSFTVLAGIYHVAQNSYGTGASAGCSSAAASTCSGTQNYDSLVGDYHLTARTDVYAGVLLSRVTGGPASGFFDASNRTVGTGLRHTF
jgi:predicted porin